MAKPTMLAVSGQRELIDQRRAVHVDQRRINDFDALGYVGDSVERPLQLVGNSDVGLGKAMRVTPARPAGMRTRGWSRAIA